MDKQILVERETYTKNDRTFFSYFVKGVVRGKTVRAAMVPPDNGGYSLLEIVFGDDMQAPLSVKPFEIKDDKTGEVIKGNTYSVSTTDKDTGDVYECPIKPFRKSDKALLNMLLR